MINAATIDSSDQPGLGTFFLFSWSPPDRNQFDKNISAAIIYRGPFSGRDQDIVGLGFTKIEFITRTQDRARKLPNRSCPARIGEIVQVKTHYPQSTPGPRLVP